MRTFFLSGLIFFLGVNLLHGQVNFTMNGLEVENHKEVDILIESLPYDALNIGLTVNRIESRVNVRLRQVGLRPVADRSEYLYIQINVVDNSFNINISFSRRVFFYVEGVEHRTGARVYNRGNTGTHSGNPEFIISALDQLLDEFLSDYLDAND